MSGDGVWNAELVVERNLSRRWNEPSTGAPAKLSSGLTCALFGFQFPTHTTCTQSTVLINFTRCRDWRLSIVFLSSKRDAATISRAVNDVGHPHLLTLSLPFVLYLSIHGVHYSYLHRTINI